MVGGKHTAGPWIATYYPHSHYGWTITEKANWVIANVIEKSLGEEMAKANAKLIAAAPELLEACEAMAFWMTEHGCVPPLLLRAGDVIAKATK